MSVSIKKLWNDYGIGGLLIAIVVLYGLYMLYNNLMSKGMYGNESMAQERPKAYDNSSSSAPQPAQESGNEVYSGVGGSSSQMPSMDSNQNPSDLLPKDNNSQWAQLNPAGQGDLANINLLKAGYHIGIDTVG